MTNLFVDYDTTKNVNLSTLRADYCCDNSGSTGGSILDYEKISAKTISNIITPRKFVSWNSNANEVLNFDSLTSGGGTDPCTFLPFIKNSSCLVVYTDGQIDKNNMDKFQQLSKDYINDIPIIVIFTVDSDMTINTMQIYVNMSIPEAFLSISNNVIIFVTFSNYHYVLMSKGCFMNYYEPVNFVAETKLTELPKANLDLLRKIIVPSQLDSNLIRLNGFEKPLNMDALYMSDNIDIGILLALSNRMILPRINLDMMQSHLIKLIQKMNDNPELKTIRDKLSLIAVSNPGSEQHKELIKEYNKIKTEKNNSVDKEKLNVINKFLTMIADYRADNTSVVLGSNRANRAVVFSNVDLIDIGNCIQFECPIMMDQHDACILIKNPSKPDYVKEYTSDYAMECPFEFGTWLTDLVTPGIVSHTIANNLDKNPFTRENIIGFIPLSYDPMVIMKHMSKLFGGNREMWHMVRGFISMIAHAIEKPYFSEHKPIVVSYLEKFFENYNATVDLKGSTEKVPLVKAFQNVLTNYHVCLRDRSANDVKAILHIADIVMPKFSYEKDKILSMIDVIDTFAKLLNEHKKGENIKKYVMILDDYEHYVENIKGVKGLIAQLFWYDVDGEYRQYKLQIALQNALNSKKFGKALQDVFVGKPFDESILDFAHPNPIGDHFGDEQYNVWNSSGLNDSLQCCYCGIYFDDSKQKIDHLKEKLMINGNSYFFNGHLAVKHTVDELGINTSEKDLFISAKNLLYKRYGEKAGFLHTPRAKVLLLRFIKRFKEFSSK